MKTETAAIEHNRYEEARAAGLNPYDAQRFAASDADVGQLRKLVAGGCSPELIVRILL